MTFNVLISCPHLQKTIDTYRDSLTEKGITLEVPSMVQQLSELELLNMIDRFDGVIAGDDPFTAKVLEKGKRLKVIAKWGIGVDSIDLEAAERLGIPVVNTPGAFPDEVADVALGYVILLARHLHKLDRSVRNGDWEQIPGTTLRGKTLGVIGVGSIGQAMVTRGLTVGMSVVGYDIYPIRQTFLEETGMQQIALDELLSTSDFIVLCCNLTPENMHMLSHTQFDKMKSGVRLVNVARGPLVHEEALAKALADGKVLGAALDVFEVEPLPEKSDLRQYDQCIFGTHNSSHTREAVARVNDMAIANLLQGLGIES